MMKSCMIAAFFGIAVGSSGIDTARWHGRSIYFVVTDRFARNNDAINSSEKCGQKEWCGGTLRGVARKLDYIHGMGFDAIWITPVVKQVDWRDNWNGTGYHGYWAEDFFSIDPHLGTEDDLLSLKQECKQRGMLLMVDIVANHVGPIHSIDQVQQLGKGINSASIDQFHQLGRRAGQSSSSYIQNPVTEMEAGSCWPNYKFGEGCNHTVILDGWFGDLADLRQEDPQTCDYLLRWIHYMAEKYSVDGFRLDTALYMPKWFLKRFQEAAGVYMIGEVVTYNMSMHRSFAPPLTGLLNFPITEHVKRVFSTNGSMVEFKSLLGQSAAMTYPDANLLGNFLDNHDGERFLHNHSGDVSQLKNGLTWALLHHGLPIVYYGTEQVEVSNQANERTPMWPYFGRSELYMFLAALNKLRRDYGLASGGRSVLSQAVVIKATESCLAFVRDEVLAAVTNLGADGKACRLCVNVDSLPGSWTHACSAGSSFPRAVLGSVPEPVCKGLGGQEQLCVQTGDGGQPSVFALTPGSLYL